MNIFFCRGIYHNFKNQCREVRNTEEDDRARHKIHPAYARWLSFEKIQIFRIFWKNWIFCWVNSLNLCSPKPTHFGGMHFWRHIPFYLSNIHEIKAWHTFCFFDLMLEILSQKSRISRQLRQILVTESKITENIENVAFSRSFQRHHGAKLVFEMSRKIAWKLLMTLIGPKSIQKQVTSECVNNKNAQKQQFLVIFSTKMSRNWLRISFFLSKTCFNTESF